MRNITDLLKIFVVVQMLFILLDLFELWREGGKKSLSQMVKDYKQTFLFLLGMGVLYFMIQNALMAIMPPMATLLAGFKKLFALPTPREPLNPHPFFIGLLFLGTYMVTGFWDYLFHRVIHTSRFWFLHENHHLPTQVFNGMPGISVRPFVAPITFITYFFTMGTFVAVMKGLGTPGLLNAYVHWFPQGVLIFTVVGSASHSLFLRKFMGINRWLRFTFITTPQEHILHHAANLKCNYGNFMILWDRVFGTYLDPLKFDLWQLRLGLNYDQDFLGTLTLGQWTFSEKWRKKYNLSRYCFLEGVDEQRSIAQVEVKGRAVRSRKEEEVRK